MMIMEGGGGAGTDGTFSDILGLLDDAVGSFLTTDSELLTDSRRTALRGLPAGKNGKRPVCPRPCPRP